MPFDASQYEYREPATDKLRICHAPRNRWFKGTQQILAAVERARSQVDLEFELIEGLPHREAIRRKRNANLLIDHLGDAEGTTGYGMNSLEALAMGIPCMTSMSPDFEAFRRPHPFVVITEEDLKWVEETHSADRIVEFIYDKYRELGWMDEDGRATPGDEREVATG